MSRILIVDDNDINLSMLRMLLEAEGFEVVEASNGLEALDRAHEQPVDLTITDVLMPEMDGFTLCRTWRADPDLRQVPLVIYTATYTEPKDMELALSLGAVRFLVKPCDAEVLLGQVRDLLGEGQDAVTDLPEPASLDEPTYYRKYSEVLIRKLEDKMMQLEESNRALERTVEHVVRQRDRLKRLTTARDNAAAAILITDRDGRIEWVNRKFSSLTGFSSREAVGRTPAILRSGEHGPDFYEKLWETILDRRPWRGRIVNRRKDGSTYPEEMTIAPVTERDGEITHFVAIKNDISRQLEMEEQLVRGKRLEALGTLAGGLAHDFSNILQAMTSVAEVMEDECPGPGSERLRELLDEHRDLIERGARMTRQLLTFSRGGRIRTDRLDLNRVVEGSAELLRRLAGHRAELRLVLDPEPLPFKGDQSQLEQLLVNLVVNGRDALGGDGSLVVSTGRDGGDWIWLEVRDGGPGIAEELQQRIFEPLFTTKPAGEGTGLGLAVVRQVAERHGGRVVVTSRPGDGSCFRVELPTID